MGESKRMLEELEEKRQIATNIALHTKILIKCDVCSDITDPGGDKSPAYAYANSLITNQANSVQIFNLNRQELLDLIKDVIDESGTECNCQMRSRD